MEKWKLLLSNDGPTNQQADMRVHMEVKTLGVADVRLSAIKRSIIEIGDGSGPIIEITVFTISN